MRTSNAEVGWSLALASVAATATGAFLLSHGVLVQGLGASAVGLVGLLGVAPLVVAKPAGGPAPGACRRCGFVAGAGHPALAFCLMCGAYPRLTS